MPTATQVPRRPIDAAEFLRSRGYTVEAADDIPGLWNVNGREVTTGQLQDIAVQAAAHHIPTGHF